MAPSLSPASTHYALVVDAGSSGSRLQIYSWRDPELERAEILQAVARAREGRVSGKTWWSSSHTGWLSRKGKGKSVESIETAALRRLVRVGKGVDGDAWVKRVEPGISSVAPQDIAAYLAPLLSHALQQIPPSQHASTPVHVLATAGMRLLPEAARHAILKATCDTLRRDYPFAVDGPACAENVRVISGEEEGMWGWVAVNYLMDGFGHAPSSSTTAADAASSASRLLPLAPLAQEPPRSSSSDSVTPVDVDHHSPTFGFLDMGGASTQLAFSPSKSELEKSGYPPSDLGKVSLRLLSGEDVEWPVFVASWLDFGTNRVRERYVETLVSQWRAASADGVLDLSTPIQDPCLPSGLQLPSPNPSSHPGFVGSGSFATCLADLIPLLNHAHPCPAEHCLFGGIPTPHIDFEREDQRGFIGVSEYWYTAQQVLGLGGVWDWGEWEKGMSAFCSRDWDEIEHQVEHDKNRAAESLVELSRLQMQCFKGAWISNVLHEGIGIPRLVDAHGNDTLTGGALGDTNTEAERRAREKGLYQGKPKHHFQSMDEIGETAISWTLGKMVIEASKAVQPRSAVVEAAWRSRLPSLDFDNVEQRLSDLGIQAVWAYAMVSLALVLCLFHFVRRRARNVFGLGGGYKRTRKPSVRGGLPISSTSSSTGGGFPSWIPFIGAKDDYSSMEDGIDFTKPAPRVPTGRLRLWSLRLANLLGPLGPLGRGSTHERPRASRNGSSTLPLTSTSYAQAAASSSWVPSSPGRSSSMFFTPAVLSVPGQGASPAEPRLSASSASPQPSSASLASSPPRPKTSRPSRSRRSSGTAGKASEKLAVASSAGWNDPPVGLLAGEDNFVQSASASRGLEHSTAMQTAAISRQSSRVNLSEMGLAQRSRAATPLEDEIH